MATLYILIACFFFGAALAISAWIFVAESRYMKKRSIKKRLLYLSVSTTESKARIKLYREQALEDANFLVKLSYNLQLTRHIARKLHAAGLSISPLLFTILAVAGNLAAITIAILLHLDPGLILSVAVLYWFLPIIFLSMRTRSLREKFFEQLPEALDLLSRALRAGHALTSGLSMVSEEMAQPIRGEFGTLVDEINFGMSFKEAFIDLTERVPLTDLKFFSVAMLIQRESGGNIAEIMDNISNLIRERIQFRRQVNTLTAEGRLSGIILLALPFLLFGYMYFVNEEYISLLWRDSIGLYMLGYGIFSIVLGALAIKKITDIEI